VPPQGSPAESNWTWRFFVGERFSGCRLSEAEPSGDLLEGEELIFHCFLPAQDGPGLTWEGAEKMVQTNRFGVILEEFFRN
jgi:hypothetical protein